MCMHICLNRQDDALNHVGLLLLYQTYAAQSSAHNFLLQECHRYELLAIFSFGTIVLYQVFNMSEGRHQAC